MANDFSGNANCRALYRFESGALFTDSKGSNDMTDQGSTATDTTNYKEGSASADFDGSSDYARIANADMDAAFPFKASVDTDWTVCFWWRPHNSANSESMVTSKGSDLSSHRFRFAHVANSFILYVNLDGESSWNEDVQVGGFISSNNWYHVQGRYEKSSKTYYLRIWDESGSTYLSDSHSYAKDPNCSGTTYFGVGAEAQNGNNPFEGNIDELVIFDSFLSTSDLDDIRDGAYGGSVATGSLELSSIEISGSGGLGATGSLSLRLDIGAVKQIGTGSMTIRAPEIDGVSGFWGTGGLEVEREISGTGTIGAKGSLSLSSFEVSGHGHKIGEIYLPKLDLSGSGKVSIIGAGAVETTKTIEGRGHNVGSLELPLVEISGSGKLGVVGKTGRIELTTAILGSGEVPLVGTGRFYFPKLRFKGGVLTGALSKDTSKLELSSLSLRGLGFVGPAWLSAGVYVPNIELDGTAWFDPDGDGTYYVPRIVISGRGYIEDRFDDYLVKYRRGEFDELVDASS